jgi:hypothetical protein
LYEIRFDFTISRASDEPIRLTLDDAGSYELINAPLGAYLQCTATYSGNITRENAERANHVATARSECSITVNIVFII